MSYFEAFGLLLFFGKDSCYRWKKQWESSHSRTCRNVSKKSELTILWGRNPAQKPCKSWNKGINYRINWVFRDFFQYWGKVFGTGNCIDLWNFQLAKVLPFVVQHVERMLELHLNYPKIKDCLKPSDFPKIVL